MATNRLRIADCGLRIVKTSPLFQSEIQNPKSEIRIRSAFTLLEILLALGLATACVTLVCMAIHFYLQTVDMGRTQVEELQLARSILQQISFDLKQTANYQVPSGTRAGNAPSTGTQSNQQASSNESPSGNSGGNSDSSSTEGGAGSQQEAETPAIPGLYGTQYELAIDVGRMPRLDELEQLVATGAPHLLGAAGGLQTVAYYVRGNSATSGTSTASTASIDSVDTPGLVRRSTGRPMTVWALENGAMDWLIAQEKLLAPEVTAIEFRYYDGTQWVNFWDTQEVGGLPLAVEVAIAIASPRAANQQRTMASRSVDQPLGGQSGEQIYRLLVPLPMAQAGAGQVGASGDGNGGTETENSR